MILVSVLLPIFAILYQNVMHIACNGGHMDVIKLLMDRGVDINLQNKASDRFSYIMVAPVM